MGGAFAMQALERLGISIHSYTSSVGDWSLSADYTKYDLSTIDSNDVRCPDAEMAARMRELIRKIKGEGDTIGGIITCVIKGVPAGLGEPVFGKLHAMLGAAMLGINAVKGFEYGMGFAGVSHRGSEMIDSFVTDANGKVSTTTNNSGGIQGGISNGEDIYFRVAFKPTIDDSGNPVTLKARGRHDPCVLPRAVPVVDAMAAMTLLDAYLLNKATRL